MSRLRLRQSVSGNHFFTAVMPCQGAACDAHSVLVQREPAQDSHARVKLFVLARAEPLIEVGSAAGRMLRIKLLSVCTEGKDSLSAYMNIRKKNACFIREKYF